MCHFRLIRSTVECICLCDSPNMFLCCSAELIICKSKHVTSSFKLALEQWLHLTYWYLNHSEVSDPRVFNVSFVFSTVSSKLLVQWIQIGFWSLKAYRNIFVEIFFLMWQVFPIFFLLFFLFLLWSSLWEKKRSQPFAIFKHCPLLILSLV